MTTFNGTPSFIWHTICWERDGCHIEGDDFQIFQEKLVPVRAYFLGKKSTDGHFIVLSFQTASNFLPHDMFINTVLLLQCILQRFQWSHLHLGTFWDNLVDLFSQSFPIIFTHYRLILAHIRPTDGQVLL